MSNMNNVVLIADRIYEYVVYVSDQQNDGTVIGIIR